jgi:uncharacterized protein YukE
MATAGHIRVTPEQLGAIAGQLNAGAANIEQINQQLQGQVAPVGSDWAGVAQARCGPSGGAPHKASSAPSRASTS